jgi:nitrogen fixation protein NifU and related proteins
MLNLRWNPRWPMFDELNDLYQEVILDHSRKPRNFRRLENATGFAEGNNPLCGDHFTVSIRLERDSVADIAFQGSGCAISKAAASMMTEAVKGRTTMEARELFSKFQELVKTGRGNEANLGKLSALSGVHKFPMRVKCALLAWHAMHAALGGVNKTVSTESHGRT